MDIRSEAKRTRTKRYMVGVTAPSKFILSKILLGELVPQDMNDEPASELLKRFKAKTKDNQTP